MAKAQESTLRHTNMGEEWTMAVAYLYGSHEYNVIAYLTTTGISFYRAVEFSKQHK